MKILEKAVMPDGTSIILEDWSENYPGTLSLAIGAYPIAMNTGKFGMIKKGETFRLSIHSSQYRNYTDSDIRSDFEALKRGDKTLKDLSVYFWNNERDMWFLGMDVEKNPEW